LLQERTRITVAPYWHVAAYVRDQKPDAVISILSDLSDKLARPDFKGVASVLKLHFDDVLEDGTRGGVRPTRFIAPSIADVAEIINFAQQVGTGKHYLCHCRAGASRSVSASLVIACALDAPPEKLRELRFLRNYFKPSLAILRHTKTLLPDRSEALLEIAGEQRPWTRADDWAPASILF